MAVQISQRPTYPYAITEPAALCENLVEWLLVTGDIPLYKTYGESLALRQCDW